MKIIYTIAVLTLFCVACFGQSSYKGLTPGQSTRADVQRVLGQPVKSVSKSLAEYKSPDDVPWRLYVQYRTESPTAVVERIERTCLKSDTDVVCLPAINEFNIQLEGVLDDAFSTDQKPQGPVFVSYYGAPRFIVETTLVKGRNYETRLAIYSEELYQSTVPKGGCTGTIFGTWQTERGRVTIVRVSDSGIQGTYSKNNGSFSLRLVSGGYMGEWKDDTGSGTMALMLRNRPGDSFEASLSRGAVAPVSSKQSPARSKIGSKVGSEIEKILKSGTGAAVGAIITEPSGGLSRISFRDNPFEFSGHVS